jgi:hypothetical protein
MYTLFDLRPGHPDCITLLNRHAMLAFPDRRQAGA